MAAHDKPRVFAGKLHGDAEAKPVLLMLGGK